MKRESFEDMVQGALDAMAADTMEKPISKMVSRKRGIGSLRFGESERTVARAVSLLASMQRIPKPLAVPSPDMVPPCF